MPEINFYPETRQLRQFGFIAFIAFGLLGAMIQWKRGLLGISFGEAANWIAYSMGALGAISALLSRVFPAGNRPLYLILVVITYPIGYVTSFILMALLFYGVLTMIAIAFRLLGRDVLQRKFEPQASSYWVPHVSPASPKRYLQQF